MIFFYNAGVKKGRSEGNRRKMTPVVLCLGGFDSLRKQARKRSEGDV